MFIKKKIRKFNGVIQNINLRYHGCLVDFSYRNKPVYGFKEDSTKGMGQDDEVADMDLNLSVAFDDDDDLSFSYCDIPHESFSQWFLLEKRNSWYHYLTPCETSRGQGFEYRPCSRMNEVHYSNDMFFEDSNISLDRDKMFFKSIELIHTERETYGTISFKECIASDFIPHFSNACRHPSRDSIYVPYVFCL